MAAAVARADALAARVAGLAVDGAGWSAGARAVAAARLAAMGLPGRRDEYWRYTDPAALNAAAAPGAPPYTGAGVFDALDRLRIVFTDGAFDTAASDDLSGAGIEIETLGAARSDIHWAREVYGVLEGRGQVPVARPHAALGTAYARDGVLIRATGRAVRPVELVYRAGSGNCDPILHHCVKVEAGASVTLLESDHTAGRMVTVLEADLAPGARFHHVRVQGPGPARAAATHVFLRVGAGAVAKSFTLSDDGRLTRNEVVIELAGDAGVAHVAGAVIGDGATHHDDTVFVTHAGVGCESRQVFKKVLTGGAIGVFQGKILVKPGAQKTDGYQISQSLLLDEASQFLAKPELEIYADDVKCSHGSTSGAIDAVALFYLRSRGVPEARARALLVLSFLAAAVAEIEDADIAAAVQARLEHLLAVGA